MTLVETIVRTSLVAPWRLPSTPVEESGRADSSQAIDGTPPGLLDALALLMETAGDPGSMSGAVPADAAGEEWVARELAIIAATQRVTAWADLAAVHAAARLQVAVTDVTQQHWQQQYDSVGARPGWQVEHEAASATLDEITLATGWSTGQARSLLQVAEARDGAASTALTHLADGTTTYARVRAVVDATSECNPEDVAGIITERVLRPTPDGSSPGHDTFTRRLRRQVLLFQPDQPRRHADAIERRTAFGQLHDDGTGTLTVTGDAVRIVAALDRIDDIARSLRCHGDSRNLDQLRSDLALDVLLIGWPQTQNPSVAKTPHVSTTTPSPSSESAATAQRRQDPEDLCPVDRDLRGTGWVALADDMERQARAHPPGMPERPHPDDLIDPIHLSAWSTLPVAPAATVHVVVSLATLLGVDDGLAEIPGHGDLPAAQARRLALTHGSVWRRLVTDPATGTALELSTHRYRPTTAMADQISALDNTCRAPGCHVPAARSDIDHTIPWPRGTTSTGNLGALHRRHHNHKTRGLWHASRDPDGLIHWRVLSGRTYTSHPHHYLDPDLQKPPPPPQRPPVGLPPF